MTFRSVSMSLCVSEACFAGIQTGRGTTVRMCSPFLTSLINLRISGRLLLMPIIRTTRGMSISIMATRTTIIAITVVRCG